MKVVFNKMDIKKSMTFNKDIALKDMLTSFVESVGKPKDKINNFLFLSNGKSLDIKSSVSLCKCLKEEDVILVFENEDPNSNENNEIDKINSNQFMVKNCKNLGQKIQEVLKDMAIYGCLTKKIIESTISIGANSLMTVNEAIMKGDKDEQLFILGIFGKYLCNLGINTYIDIAHNVNEKYKNLSITALQFVSNGLIFQKKYYLVFGFNEDKIREYLGNMGYQNKFKEKLLNGISELYGLSKLDITITNPIHDKDYLLIVLIHNEKIQLTKEDLMKKFQYIPDLCELKYVQKENIIDGIILNKCMLDPEGDNKDGGWAYYEQRGGEDYLPPEGWDRYGLSVFNKYDNCNNDWLSYDNRKGEWCIGYSWLTYNNSAFLLNKEYENDEDIKNSGKKVGNGVFCSQDPEIMENYTQPIDINGVKYKLGLMLRINPSKIRCPKSKTELWVVDGFSDDIRPYGILIQKIKK